MSKKAPKKAGGKKAPTKSEILNEISGATGLKRKDVAGCFDALTGAVGRSLKGCGIFTIPGLVKIRVVRRPATKEREGKNPFTGQPMIIKAKPARNVVKATALKALKSMV